MSKYIYEFLTNSDKIDIIDLHIKANETNLYALELNKHEYSLESPVDQSRIDIIDAQIESTKQKIMALKSKKTSLL